MNASEAARVRAYLLGRLPEQERTELESRFLEDPELLENVKLTEEEFLGGRLVPRARLLKLCLASFGAGLMAGALLAEAMRAVL